MSSGVQGMIHCEAEFNSLLYTTIAHPLQSRAEFAKDSLADASQGRVVASVTKVQGAGHMVSGSFRIVFHPSHSLLDADRPGTA